MMASHNVDQTRQQTMSHCEKKGKRREREMNRGPYSGSRAVSQIAYLHQCAAWRTNLDLFFGNAVLNHTRNHWVLSI